MLNLCFTTLQRSRHDIKMQSPYKSTGPKRTQKTSNDLERPELTSKESSPINETVKPNTSTKNNMKGGSLIKKF